MPVNIDGKTFDDHDSAVAHLKRTRPDITKPDAYVATVERAEKDAKLSRVASLLIASGGFDITCSSCGEHALGKSGSIPASCPSCGTKMGKIDSTRKKESLANPKFKKITKLASSSLPYEGEEDKRKDKKREEEANPTFKKGKEEEDDRIDSKTGKPKASFTLLEKGEYGIGKKYKGASHPFNKMASLYKLQILSRVKGASYVPRDSDPTYENLDVESRQGIDHLFNEQKVGIIAAKLASMAFSGSASADTKKTGADVEKEKEKITKGTTNPFDFLGAKIREAVMSDFVYNQTSLSENREGDKGEKKNKQLGAPVSVTEPKKDPEEFGGGLSAKTKSAKDDRYPEEGPYKIIRIYHPSLDKSPRKIKGGLTLTEAHAHTRDPKTRKDGQYFDAFAPE